MSVVFHGPNAPTNLEWQRYVTQAAASDARDKRVIILSRGGSPDGPQRQLLMTTLRGRPSPVALLTDKVLARAAIAAMSLFNPSMKAFPTTGLKDASEFLGLSPSERERVAQLLVVLEKEVTEATVAEAPKRTETR